MEKSASFEASFGRESRSKQSKNNQKNDPQFIYFVLLSFSLNPMGQELILASLRMLFCHWNMLFILMICNRTKLSSWSLWLIRLIRLFLLNLSLSSRTIRTVPFKLFLLFSSFTILFFKVWYFLTNTTTTAKILILWLKVCRGLKRI